MPYTADGITVTFQNPAVSRRDNVIWEDFTEKFFLEFRANNVGFLLDQMNTDEMEVSLDIQDWHSLEDGKIVFRCDSFSVRISRGLVFGSSPHYFLEVWGHTKPDASGSLSDGAWEYAAHFPGEPTPEMFDWFCTQIA
ncbi:gp094 [Rhodococcus phage ReqiDocB7]|uniref:gp094 n=1 Tax=Rhodococcus phage ReqiDocB7 TaxID=691966 RepID=UPI0001CDD877|nr:gp094 [Rhodococcus phage ReqiDocB7]ADD80880.1 gp094 [Rhodococcus phage ReqiDocB7]